MLELFSLTCVATMSCHGTALGKGLSFVGSYTLLFAAARMNISGMSMSEHEHDN